MCEVKPCVCFGVLPVRQKFAGATTKAFAMKHRSEIRNDWNVKKLEEKKGQRKLDAGWG